MAGSIVVERLGGPEVMAWRDVDVAAPGPGQLQVRIAAAGVNYIDTYHRTGLYPVPLPFTTGVEGAGVVTGVGEGVDGLDEGDRVAWSGALGSYATDRIVPADGVVTVPLEVPLDLAAAVLLQGMTAHYLCHDTYPVAPGDLCLVHAGAGGVGGLLIQMIKRRGGIVFATVGSPEKAVIAADAGADHVIDYRAESFREAIEEIAGERALAAVFDGVGAGTFEDGLALLRRRGMMVTFGNAGGPVPAVAPLDLMRAGSVFLTRPTLFDYVATRAELERRAAEVFAWVASGELTVRVGARFPLASAPDAHRALEGRETTGKVLLEA